MILYRADKRTRDVMEKQFKQGFAAWCPLDISQARKFASLFAGSKDTAGLPQHLVEHFKAGAKLNDLSAHIKWTKNQTQTVWISTAINEDCGGQSTGATIHKFSIDLREFTILGSGLLELTQGRQSDLKPSLLLDSDNIMSSNLIAINHGPRKDAEVAFLTTIPLNYLV